MHLFFHVVLIGLCLASCFSSGGRRRHSVKQTYVFSTFQNMDQRYPGEFTCHKNSSRLTTFGIDVLQHTFTPLRPGNPLGEKIFDIQMEVSADCATWEPLGYNVDRTKRSALGIQTKETDSLAVTARGHSDHFSESTTVAILFFSATAKHETSKQWSNSVRERKRFRNFISWIESVDNTVRFSHISPPNLAGQFLGPLLSKIHESQFSPEFFWDYLLPIGTHFLEQVELGSRLTEIRRVNMISLSKSLREQSSKQFSAEVKVSFKDASLHAGVGSGNSQNSDSAQTEIGNSSQISRTTSGNNFDFSAMSFGVAKKPGVLRKTLQPICVLIPRNTSLLSAAQKKCFEFFRMKAFCFSQFPEFGLQLNERTMNLLREHFIAMQTVAECKDIPPPTFGAKLVSRDERSLESNSLTFRECLWFGLQHEHKMISFHEGSCVTMPSLNSAKFSIQKCTGSACVVVPFEWSDSRVFFFPKSSTVVGELMRSTPIQPRFWSNEADFCTLHNVMYRMYKSGTKPDRSDPDRWNNIVKNTLLQTYARHCEYRCQMLPNCRFVHKTFQFAWNFFGLDESYRTKQNHIWHECPSNGDIAAFRETHRIQLNIACDFYASVQYVNADADRAINVHENYGKFLTSEVQLVDNKFRLSSDNPKGIIDSATWTAAEQTEWSKY